MASASSGGGAEGIGDAMTGLAMLGATAVAGGAALALAPEAAAPDVASPLGEQLADLGPVLGTAAALAPGGLHESNSLDIPYFVTSGRQYSLKRKLDRFYGKGDFDYNEELAKNVKDAYPLCKDLLGYLTFNPVMSVAKNIYNITDPAHSHLGAGSRSSAFNSMRCNHHIARGAANEAELFQEAAKVNRLFTEIKALGGFDDYQASVEFVLLACSMYMVHGSGDAHAKIMSAVPLNARCQYAFYNGKVRNDELISDKGVIVDFLEERGRAISDVVQREFRKRTADDQKVKVLAFAQTGAEQLPLGHADYDKRCVGRVNATVAEVDGATLRIGGKNAGRFADHAFHAWYLLTLTLHLGLSLPTDAEPLKVAQWWWHSASSTCLHSTPSTRRLLLLDGVDIDAGGCRVTGRLPHRWGNSFHFALGEHLLGKGRYKSQEPTKPKPEPNRYQHAHPKAPAFKEPPAPTLAVPSASADGTLGALGVEAYTGGSPYDCTPSHVPRGTRALDLIAPAEAEYAALSENGLPLTYDPDGIAAFWSAHRKIALRRVGVIATRVVPFAAGMAVERLTVSDEEKDAALAKGASSAQDGATPGKPGFHVYSTAATTE